MKKIKLPSSWLETTIGTLSAYVQRGKSPRYADKSELPVINQKCIRWHGIEPEHLKFIHPEQFSKWTNERFLQLHDILWNSTGTGTIGRACLYKTVFEKAVVDSHVTIVRVFKDLIDPRYVFYFIASPMVQKNIEDMQSGSTNQVELGKTAICETLIPLAPFKEQSRIVDKIEALFSDLDYAEENVRTAQKRLKRYRQSVLKAAVTGELTKEWREANAGNIEPGSDLLKRILKLRKEQWKGRGKYKEPKPVSDINSANLPTNWTWTTLDALIVNGPQNGIYLHKSLYGNGTPILRIDDFQIGWIQERAKLQKVQSGAHDAAKYALKERDIVINRVNSVSHLGKTILIESTHANCIYESNMMRIALTEGVYPEFLAYYLGSDLGRNRLIKNCKHAVNQASINQQDVQSTIVPLPCYEEQKEVANKIADIFSQITAMEAWCETELKRSASLRQSILKSAFAGELVAQDPSDEPASELLKRIQVERESLSKAKPKAPKRAKVKAPKQARKATKSTVKTMKKAAA